MGSSPIFHPTERNTEFNFRIRLRVLHTGLSPSGKATDFDSVIPWVRIPPAQPGVAPQASRESHFVGFAIFLPAFCIDIYFITLTQTCGAHFAHRRFFFLLKFCARAYSGYLFRQRFPAAGCRVQVANFMLMRFAVFLPALTACIDFVILIWHHTLCGVFSL